MDREHLLKKVSNLIDRTNTKARKFEKEGYGKVTERYKKQMEHIANKYSSLVNLNLKSGYMSKGIKKLDKLGEMQLQDIYSSLSALGQDENIGTVKKYKSYLDRRNDKYKKAFEKHLQKGSFKDISSEDIERLYDMLDIRKLERNYSSSQVINEFALQFGYVQEEDEEEMKSIINEYQREKEILSKFKLSNRKRGGNRR